MKKAIYTVCFLLALCNLNPCLVIAQLGGKTQVEDILAAMPVQNKQQLEKNMQAIAALGQNGLTQLAATLKPIGKEQSTAAEYALNSYSFYVMQPGREAQRAVAANAYLASLGLLYDNTAKQFIIKQLQQIGKEEAVPVLKNYLADQVLSGPAARALAQINTPSSAQVLLTAMATLKDGPQQNVIEALGDVGYKPAVNALITIAPSTTDIPLKRVTLYALASIGSPAAADVLQAAAQKANYTYDITNAVSSYLFFLHKLAAGGNAAKAEGLATQLMKNAQSAAQTHTRAAALQLLAEIKGPSALPLLKTALLDNDIKFRGAALSFATKLQSPAANKEWLALLPSLAPAAQVQVIDFLSQTGDASLLLGLQKLLKNNNAAVKIAAIGASAKIGGKAALPVLLVVMKNGNADDVAAAKAALLILKSTSIVEPVAKALPGMPATAKIALIEVLAARSATAASHEIFVEVGSKDTAVHSAAVKALPAVVGLQNLKKLCAWLNQAPASDVPYLQQAIIAASAAVKEPADRADTILAALRAAQPEKQYLYYNVLASVGGKTALTALQQAYANGGATAKAAALVALAKTNDGSAARILLQIAHETPEAEGALDGYISIIQHTAAIPADQKLLMLKEAMATATTAAQQKKILVETGKCKTFLALVFAGTYLDSPALQQVAAYAVMDIALSNDAFNGELVVALLKKVLAVLSGPDADYDKQDIRKHIADITGKAGFSPMFNGKDLTGWKGLVENPIARAKMNPDTLAAQQAKADKVAQDGWFAKDGLLVFSGHGENLCTVKQYGDFEMFVDWKITNEGDAGIYLRGSPQVQIWDTSRISVGAQVGSGGLYNNQTYPSKPLALADNAIGEWNSFHIIMRGDKVTVYLNGVLVTDNVVLENYWDRSLPIFVKEQIELQAHGTYVAYRDLYIKELTGSPAFALSSTEKKDGFTVLFDGSNLDQWTGNTIGYKIDQGSILVDTADGHPGNLYTKQQYGDFVLRFEFQLTPGANNGIGIRAPLEGDAAYVGMEIQVLDNEADMYKDLHAYQYHGSVYGVIPAKRGFLEPTGQWNYEEITAKGANIKVVLNGTVILDGNIDEASKNGTADKREHPGLHNPAGHIGFLGHGAVVRFRNLRIKEL